LQIVVPPPGPTAGQLLTSGGSATVFALNLPNGASCSGDTASGGYVINSYMVPASVDPATLSFDSNGPTPFGTGANLRVPLYSSSGSTPFMNGTTGVAASSGGPGLVVGLPSFSFNVFGANGHTVVPAGTYNLGVACWNTTANPHVLDKYWNVQMAFVATPSDSPGGITWTAVAVTPPTTTTTTTAATTTTTSGSTTSTAGSSTTVAESSTTTPVDSSTTVVGDTSTTSVGGSGGVDTTVPPLVTTGASPISPIVWGVLLLVLGRIVILIGRRIRVQPSDTP
jgi:hypothetical protein